MGKPLNSFELLYEKRLHKNLTQILNDPTQPMRHYFDSRHSNWSGGFLLHITNTNHFKASILPSALSVLHPHTHTPPTHTHTHIHTDWNHSVCLILSVFDFVWFPIFNVKVTVRAISTMSSKLLVGLGPNLVMSIISQSVLWKNWITVFTVKVTAKVQYVSECLIPSECRIFCY